MSNNSYIANNFVKALNYYQVVSGKTKKEIAESIGVPPTTYSSWSNGKHLPDMEKLQALSICLHAPITHFFDFDLSTQFSDPLVQEITELVSQLPNDEKLLLRAMILKAIQLHNQQEA